MAEKLTQKERLKEITDSIESEITTLFASDKYAQYLRTMSRFHRYSVNNTMLIAMQNPEATVVAGFNKWRDSFHRNVKKGEKGIKIIAPTPYKIKEQQEKIDPVTKAPLLDANGQVQTEEVEKQIPMFRVVSVFDVSQTEGEPLPTLSSDLTGNVAHFSAFMDAVERTSPVPIFMESMSSDTDGFFNATTQRIAIRDDMSEVQTVSAAIHEVGTWYVVDATAINGTDYFLLEHEEHGDEAACIIVDKDGKLVLDDVWNSFDDLEYFLESQTVEAPTQEVSVQVQEGFPLPDPSVSIEDRNQYGYTYDEILPLRKERAFDLFENDVAIFLLYPDNTEAMAFDTADIDSHAGYFGIERIDWENYCEHKGIDPLQRTSTEQQEQNSLASKTDCYTIYQLSKDEANHYHRFTSLEMLEREGLTVRKEGYDEIYSAPIANPSDSDTKILNQLYEQFNINHPADFKGHSLSVSDIIALQRGSVVSYHYVDMSHL